MTDLFDTHAHLAHEQFGKDVAEVVHRAQKAGVTRILNVGFDLDSSRLAVAQAEQLEGVYAAVGMHPHDAKKWTDATYAELRALTSHPRVVAIGETGCDFHYNFSPPHRQEEAFCALVRLSVETGLPVIVHNREADDATLATLRTFAGDTLRGVIHCFTGDRDSAARFVDVGLFVGLTGIVTFGRSVSLQEVARALPADRLLLETDCPYLAPHGWRGKRNEPAFLTAIAERIAQVRGMDFEELSHHTMQNALCLFTKCQHCEHISG